MKNIKNIFLILVCTILIFTPSYVNAEPEGETGGENEVTTPETEKTEEENEKEEETNPDEGKSEEETENKPSEDTKITLDKTELELGVKKEVTLKATVTPSDTEIKLEWSSSKENIATVKDGVVTTGSLAGETIITVKAIKGTDTVATAECKIKVTRTVSKDATLKSLNITNGTLDPEFKSDVYKYNITVNSDVSSLKIEYELSDSENAGYLVSGNSKLKNGSVVKILVTAEDTSIKKTYELTIIKDETSLDLKKLEINGYALNESFDPETTQYTASIPYEIETISVNASPKDSNATVKVSGLTNLKVGNNTVTITVKDEVGNTKKYQIIVTREKEVTVEENSTSIITSSDNNETNNQTSNNSTTIPKNDNDSDNFLKYAIVSLACLILFTIGGIGIYFYLKTSPKKLKKELEAIKKEESPIVEVSNETTNNNQESIEKVMQEELIQTKEFDIEKPETENLFDDKDV